jgi:hypothetical protein
MRVINNYKKALKQYEDKPTLENYRKAVYELTILNWGNNPHSEIKDFSNSKRVEMLFNRKVNPKDADSGFMVWDNRG